MKGQNLWGGDVQSLMRGLALSGDRSLDAGSMTIWRTRGMSPSDGSCFSMKRDQDTTRESEKQRSRSEPWRARCAPLRITLKKEAGRPTVRLSSDIRLLQRREGRWLGSNTTGFCPVTPSQGHICHQGPWNLS